MNKPVLEGGKPARKKALVFGRPEILDDEINEVVDSLKSGWIGMGPKTEEFEKLFKKFIGCKNAVAVNSCTSALFLSLKVLGIKQGDEIITSPMTFASTANVIEHLNAKPVFVDVEKTTGLIDPKKLKEKISGKTKAFIPVHLYGRPCEMDEITEIASAKNVSVLEDAAHAAEAEYKGKKIGAISDFTAFSFYATKNITAAGGGIITTSDNEAAEKIKLMRLHGVSKAAWSRFNSDEFQPCDVLVPGFKCNMNDLQAALGIHQLKRVEKNLKKRKKLTELYLQELEKTDEITLMDYSEKNIKHAYHLFALLLNLEKLSINRNKFVHALQKENIGSGIHFISLHLTSFYRQKYDFKENDFPNSKLISDRTFSLPLYPSMTEEDALDSVNAVKKLCAYYKK
ncbi:MAG: UDP-4-amino-4,6-dideoxy-N-acetyl-beta-L-altrosamine transaminase [Candidatus Diapherotrites archaeon CG10_big_fil_rev_8_21_14_0_10_31_34]|nr:MAG: UDP-4-amino-4,6-dideoxy-N-acetyl-beta-L-altrosamine transaminase [Candidatus Diapherotrites archaeon CG10_big_fil_rev_8_21_14_0_10_31_34]